MTEKKRREQRAQAAQGTERGLATLAARLGYDFEDQALLRLALTHRSMVNETAETLHNERLEFLGDAVINVVVSRLLFVAFPEANEGELSKLRAGVVNKSALADQAQRIGIGPALRIGAGENRSGGREKASLLADAFEAIVAAVYLDGGFGAAEAFVERELGEGLSLMRAQGGDPKTELQQWCQKTHHLLPSYLVADESGPEHDRTFTAVVQLGDTELGRGRGKSKKLAEQAAASAALAGIAGR